MTIPYTENTAWADDSGGGTPITAAKLNNVEQGITDAHLQPCARVYHNAAQSINDATDTVLAFNSERFDQVGGATSNQHDNSTNNSRLTCRYAGVYAITANVQFAGNGTGDRYLFLRLNGTTKITQVHVTADATENDLVVTTDYALAVNDYVEALVHQSSGGALNVQATGNWSPEFMWKRVG